MLHEVQVAPPGGGENQGSGRGEALWQGTWGMCPPEKQIKGRAGNPCNLATRGALNVGEPLANEGGKNPGRAGGGAPCRGEKIRGWRGPCPSRGVWGVSPQENQLKGRESNPCNPPTRGTLNVGEPLANEGGEIRGCRGRSP